jgi:hypothetical protein
MPDFWKVTKSEIDVKLNPEELSLRQQAKLV